MLQIEDVVVTLDIFRDYFCCNLEVCGGACCIEGDTGAPLDLDEVSQIEDVLPEIWGILAPEAREMIDHSGVAFIDSEGELVTSLADNKACVFAVKKAGCWQCALEHAWLCRGRVGFRKPVSCHLYPLRAKDFGSVKAINYHRWDICKSAVAKGEAQQMPLYRYLKESLIKKYGVEWYCELETAANELKKQNLL